MAINLISTAELENRRATKIKRGVMVVTTIVLVAYIVGVGGAFWVWVRATDSQSALDSQVQQASNRLNQLAQVEVVLEQIQARVEVVQTYLFARKAAAHQLAIVQEAASANRVQIVGWDYTAEGKTYLTVVATNADMIENMANKLKGSFAQVVEEATLFSQGQWEANITLL